MQIFLRCDNVTLVEVVEKCLNIFGSFSFSPHLT